MSALLGVSGWVLAGLSLGVAVLIRSQLARHGEVVARTCHELRGPITAVRLGLELGVRSGELSVNRLRAIELELARASLALDDLASARAAFQPVGVQAVDVGELTADSVEAWQAVATAGGGRVSVECPGLGWRVVGDRLRLAQAVGNLIANGIEHGGGDVEVRLRRRPGKIWIEVADEGPGLPEALDQLWSRRSRLRPGRRAERGHGLTIVNAIAVAHGGRLAAAPSSGGARLVLELPAASDPPHDLDVVVEL